MTDLDAAITTFETAVVELADRANTGDLVAARKQAIRVHYEFRESIYGVAWETIPTDQQERVATATRAMFRDVFGVELEDKA